MNKLFFADKGFSREIMRDRAKGYKRIMIDDALEMAAPFSFETQGTDLVAVPTEPADGVGEVFTFLCREFGLVGGDKGLRSKLSVIFCDNGWMLVTLHHGSLVVTLDGQLMMPQVGEDVEAVRVIPDNVLWVNADKLLGFSKYLENKGQFMYDFEFMFELGGDNTKGMGQFLFRCLHEETIDISLGYVAQYEQNLVKRAEAQEAKKKYAQVAAYFGGYQKHEFDEPEHDEPEVEEDDDSGVEW